MIARCGDDLRNTPVSPPLADLLSLTRRPDHLQIVDVRRLTPFQRALLDIDGTVTRFIESYMLDPVEVTVLNQTVQCLESPHGLLETGAGTEVIAREVLLRGMRRSVVYAYAVSLLVPSRLPAGIIAMLQSEPGGLGRVLTTGAIENRREVLWHGWEHLPTMPPQVQRHTGNQFLSRTYRIFIGGVPAMVINEKFPTSLADQIADPAESEE